MLFQNKVRKDIEAYKEVRSDVKDFVKTGGVKSTKQ